jgi:Protein of unknown function (DUF1036)
MQLCFQNSYSSPLSVAVMWYSPGTCGGDGGDWETRGWWNLNPGDNVHTNVWTDNRYFCFYAEAWDGAVWAGPYGAEVSIYAFDGCIDIGHSVSDGPSPYFDVGFRLVDAGWWFWTYVTYTVNLT